MAAQSKMANQSKLATQMDSQTTCINPLAPHMTQSLSAAEVELVEQYQHYKRFNPYRCNDDAVIRRENTPQDAATPLRGAFVRDVEKIMHTQAYNRLAGKTQVFSFRPQDDFCRRGLHVQLVARIARDMGRALGLNTDLIEAIALGHDIGHTPFGHAGEYFLNKVYHERTGRWFFHNVMSARVLDVLYRRNISLQMLDGALCHNGEFEQQVFKTSNLHSFEEFDHIVEACWATGNDTILHLRPMTLEGCIVRISDILAYVGKDRQDAVRAGIVNEKTFDDGLGSRYNTWALSAFSNDIVRHSLGSTQISMSDEAFAELARAKRENYEKIYLTHEVSGDLSNRVDELFEMLYEQCLTWMQQGDEENPLFVHHIKPLERSLAYYGQRYAWQDDHDLTAVDYIASMTDDYFVALCQHLDPSYAARFPHYSYFA